MRREVVWAIGAAAIAGAGVAAWWLATRRDEVPLWSVDPQEAGSSEGTWSGSVLSVIIPPKPLELAAGVPRVFNLERLAPCDYRLQAFWNGYAATPGAVPVTIPPRELSDGTLLAPTNRDDADQLVLFKRGVTKARFARDSGHGRWPVGANDFAVIRAVKRNRKGELYVSATWGADEAPELYARVGAAAKSWGLKWGGDFKSLYDPAHIEVPDWEHLALAPGVAPKGVA